MSTKSVWIVAFMAGFFWSMPASGQYDAYDDLPDNIFTTYFSPLGLTADQIVQLDHVSRSPTNYAAFLFNLDPTLQQSINNELIVVNAIIADCVNLLNNISNIYYNAIKNKKTQKKLVTAYNNIFEGDMANFPAYQTTAKKLIPAASWPAAYQAAKLLYTTYNTNNPNSNAVVQATFGTSFST